MQSEPVGPLVSVVVRTRNRPALLAEALRDIQAQDFTDYEVVVVDDGDVPGGALGVARRLTTLIDRVRVIDRSDKPHGRARAANAGLREARGRLVVLHDDDDSWASDFLSVTADHLTKNPDCWGVSVHTEVVVHRSGGPDGEEREERLLLNPALRAITIPDMLRANRITTHSFLYRREVHDEVGYYDESLVAHEDWEFYLRFLARHPIDLLPLPARAFWHHRPEAEGDEGNSVFVLDVDHQAAEARIRDEEIRRSIERTGWGPAMHLALVARSMEAAADDRAEEQRAMHDRVEARLRAMEAQLADLGHHLDDIRERVEGAKDLIVRRTSVSDVLRRARGAFRR